MKLIKGISVLSAAVLLAACGSDDDDDNGPAPGSNAPSTYTFESVVDSQESAVSYSGQVARQALINELKKYIADDAFQNGGLSQAAALGELNRIYAAGTTDVVGNLTAVNIYTGGDEATPVGVSLKTDGATLVQDTYAELSGDKNLLGKTAGVDNALTLDEFIGWDIDAIAVPGKADATGERSKPYALIQEWFESAAALAGDGNSSTDYVDTTNALDYSQLIQKFLLGSVTYSQAAEDYLKADKGLLKQNSEADKEGKPYTSLEHQWDEGFGYFGAARDYNNYTDAENKAQQDNDTNSDGEIDLNAEYSFGNSVNAVKRDVGSAEFTATDFSKNAMDAFLKGRQIIQDNFGTDPVAGEGYHVDLVEQAGIALENWEKAIAATVVHYINDTRGDLAKVGTVDFDAAAVRSLAKHWGEMKGFALGLQFSPITKFAEADQVKMHELMGEKPVFDTKANADAYAAELLEARAIIAEAYDFADDNVANW